MNFYSNFDDFLLEKNGFTHNVLLYKLNIPGWENIINSIDKEDIWKIENTELPGIPGGYQLYPHVTLLYNLRNTNINKIGSLISTLEPIKFEINGINIFRTSKGYDVLKMSVKPTEELLYIHQIFKDIFHTNSNDDYTPHITIAYLKEGTALKYVDYEYKNIIYSDTIIYSLKSGYQLEFKIDAK